MSNNNWAFKLSLTDPELYKYLKNFPEQITGISFDSRSVKPGNIFVCLQGTKANGNDFIDNAIDNGAVLLISDDTSRLDAKLFASNFINNVPSVYQKNTRRALSCLSNAFYDYIDDQLSDHLYTIGITGTDGKSSTAYLIYTALRELGINAALISTLGIFINGKEIINDYQKTRLTTPDPPELYKLIHKAKKYKSDVMILEVTSHALKFDKIHPIELDSAIFTSFSPDHQEFHEDEDDYFNSKVKIINLIRKYESPASEHFQYSKKGNLILNADNQKISHLSEIEILHNCITVGFNQDASMVISKIDEQLFQTTYQINKSLFGQTKLMGNFNLMNIGMAYEAIRIFSEERHRNFSPNTIIKSIEACKIIPGRLEQIDGAPFTVIVDYAHTPDSFDKILDTVSGYIKGRLIVVFGCAGERSKERRFGLGKLAAEKADMSIITEEDSRSESIHDIVQDIENEMIKSGAIIGDDYKIILDRKEAIEYALKYAKEDDFVLILGKGHEKSIESSNSFLPWDDREIAKKLIKSLF
jgi:UDP-N-acetylmuramoyl-L-alanyl-D-glutamate--2,6-diaminopimelate ligase